MDVGQEDHGLNMRGTSTCLNASGKETVESERLGTQKK